MLLGAHVSISGGYLNALEEARKNNMDVIQVFTKNHRYWREKEISMAEGKSFRDAMPQYGIRQAFSHAIYLISLGSENEEIIEKSILALAMEIKRCEALGLTHTVLHPGHAGSQSMDKAIDRIGSHIKKALNLTKGSKVKIAIENTAGQGSSVGGRIENIARLVSSIRSKRIGITLDTCHAFAAGYDIRTKKGITDFMKLADKEIGLDKLLNFHLNDSKGGLGSKLDRHAHIGEGLLGLEPFRYIMNHFKDVPKVLETSKENDADARNLDLLRSLTRK